MKREELVSQTNSQYPSYRAMEDIYAGDPVLSCEGSTGVIRGIDQNAAGLNYYVPVSRIRALNFDSGKSAYINTSACGVNLYSGALVKYHPRQEAMLIDGRIAMAYYIGATDAAMTAAGVYQDHFPNAASIAIHVTEPFKQDPTGDLYASASSAAAIYSKSDAIVTPIMTQRGVAKAGTTFAPYYGYSMGDDTTWLCALGWLPGVRKINVGEALFALVYLKGTTTINSLFAQICNSTGAVVSTSGLALGNTRTPTDAQSVAICPLKNGNFAVVWRGVDDATATTKVYNTYYAILNQKGAYVKSPTAIGVMSSAYISNPATLLSTCDLVPRTDGGFGAAIRMQCSDSTKCYAVFVSIDAAGNIEYPNASTTGMVANLNTAANPGSLINVNPIASTASTNGTFYCPSSALRVAPLPGNKWCAFLAYGAYSQITYIPFGSDGVPLSLTSDWGVTSASNKISPWVSNTQFSQTADYIGKPAIASSGNVVFHYTFNKYGTYCATGHLALNRDGTILEIQGTMSGNYGPWNTEPSLASGAIYAIDAYTSNKDDGSVLATNGGTGGAYCAILLTHALDGSGNAIASQPLMSSNPRIISDYSKYAWFSTQGSIGGASTLIGDTWSNRNIVDYTALKSDVSMRTDIATAPTVLTPGQMYSYPTVNYLGESTVRRTSYNDNFVTVTNLSSDLSKVYITAYSQYVVGTWFCGVALNDAMAGEMVAVQDQGTAIANVEFSLNQTVNEAFIKSPYFGTAATLPATIYKNVFNMG
ncbi:MAG: hypothetical protein ACKO0Z_13590 [Betaproteobacteria bacterium]